MQNNWIKESLTVGPSPDNSFGKFPFWKYETIINVSDTPILTNPLHLSQEYGTQYWWFPMNEVKYDIGLNSIYAAIVMLYNCEKERERVYLHCHAGINRSRIVHNCYYFMRTGEHYCDDSNKGMSGFTNKLLESCFRGYLPKKEILERFLNELNSKLEKNSGKPYGGLLDELKINNL